MKKFHPLLIAGLFLNIVYAIFLSGGYFANIAATVNSPLIAKILPVLSLLLWGCIGVQAIAILLTRLMPCLACSLGVLAGLPFFPVSLFFFWGLYLAAYDTRYAPFEKLLESPRAAHEVYMYAPPTMPLLAGLALLCLAAGIFFVPYFTPVTIKLVAALCVFLALNCFVITKGVYEKAYLHLLADRLVFAPVPYKPLISIPYSSIERANFADDLVKLTVRTGKGLQTIRVPLTAISGDLRTGAFITLRDLLQRVCSSAQLIR